MPDVDARTTPRWLQPLQLVFLVALSITFFDASFHALERPNFRQYLMGWKMFTMKSSVGTDHRAEVQWERNGPFEPVDLHSYFPAKWGSGHRYSRFRDKRRLATVAASLCYRLEEPAQAVRIVQVRWPLKPGSIDRSGAKEQVMATHPCSRTIGTVKGRTVPLHPDLPPPQPRPGPRRPGMQR